MFVVWSLFVGCVMCEVCLLFVVCCLVFVGVVGWVWFVRVRYLRLAVCCLLFVVCC